MGSIRRGLLLGLILLVVGCAGNRAAQEEAARLAEAQRQAELQAEMEARQAREAEEARQRELAEQRRREEEAARAAEEARRREEVARREAEEEAQRQARLQEQRRREEQAARAAAEQARLQARAEELRARLGQVNTQVANLEAANVALQGAVEVAEDLVEALSGEQEKYANIDPATGEPQQALDKAGIEALEAEKARLEREAEALLGRQ